MPDGRTHARQRIECRNRGAQRPRGERRLREGAQHLFGVRCERTGRAQHLERGGWIAGIPLAPRQLEKPPGRPGRRRLRRLLRVSR